MNRLHRTVIACVMMSVLATASWLVVASAGEPQDKIQQTINTVIDILADESLKSAKKTEERRNKMRQAVARYKARQHILYVSGHLSRLGFLAKITSWKSSFFDLSYCDLLHDVIV